MRGGVGPSRFLLLHQPRRIMVAALPFSPLTLLPIAIPRLRLRLSHPFFLSSRLSLPLSLPLSPSSSSRLPTVSAISSLASSASSRHVAKKLPSSFKPASICPGCGIHLQGQNPNAPGYFIVPRRMVEVPDGESTDELVVHQDLEDDELTDDDEEGDEAYSNDEAEDSALKSGWKWITLDPNDETVAELDAALDEDSIERQLNDDEEWQKSLDGFGPAGPGFGRETTSKKSKRTSSKMEKREESEKVLVCARCHELRHYGKVKDPDKENLLPDFDFEHTVGARLARTYATRTIVVMVVDSVDFDGSFPRRVAALLAELEEKEAASWKEHRSGNVPRFILVANKIDLLPKQISPVRLDHWIRKRAKDGGAPRLSGLFLVSCVKNWGIKSVLECIKELAGPRGEVWVVGAQNAGKSSLINALAKVESGATVTQLTEAPIPGTTLGLVRLGGILPAKAKLFDTPGLLHPHQIMTRLNREEQKLVQIRKELRPRTYRVKAGDTIHLGGLVRLDVKEISANSMYVTIWASIFLTCHFARTQKAQETFEKHVGVRLQPPLNKERLDELGTWVQTPITLTGDTWDKSSIDIAISGIGWLGIGLKGTADVDIWTYEGVGITTRTALVPDMARYFEKAGFTVLKGVAS